MKRSNANSQRAKSTTLRPRWPVAFSAVCILILVLSSVSCSRSDSNGARASQNLRATEIGGQSEFAPFSSEPFLAVFSTAAQLRAFADSGQSSKYAGLSAAFPLGGTIPLSNGDAITMLEVMRGSEESMLRERGDIQLSALSALGHVVTNSLVTEESVVRSSTLAEIGVALELASGESAMSSVSLNLAIRITELFVPIEEGFVRTLIDDLPADFDSPSATLEDLKGHADTLDDAISAAKTEIAETLAGMTLSAPVDDNLVENAVASYAAILQSLTSQSQESTLDLDDAEVANLVTAYNSSVQVAHDASATYLSFMASQSNWTDDAAIEAMLEDISEKLSLQDEAFGRLLDAALEATFSGLVILESDHGTFDACRELAVAILPSFTSPLVSRADSPQVNQELPDHASPILDGMSLFAKFQKVHLNGRLQTQFGQELSAIVEGLFEEGDSESEPPEEIEKEPLPEEPGGDYEPNKKTLEELCDKLDAILEKFEFDESGNLLPAGDRETEKAFCKFVECLALAEYALKGFCHLLEDANEECVGASDEYYRKKAACNSDARSIIGAAGRAALCLSEFRVICGEVSAQRVAEHAQACINAANLVSELAGVESQLGTLRGAKDAIKRYYESIPPGANPSLGDIRSALNALKNVAATQIAPSGVLSDHIATLVAFKDQLNQMIADLQKIIDPVNCAIAELQEKLDGALSMLNLMARSRPTGIGGVIGGASALADITRWTQQAAERLRNSKDKKAEAKKIIKEMEAQKKRVDEFIGALRKQLEAEKKAHKALCDAVDAIDDAIDESDSGEEAKSRIKPVLDDICKRVDDLEEERRRKENEVGAANSIKASLDPARPVLSALGLGPLAGVLGNETGTLIASDPGLGYSPSKEWIEQYVNGKIEEANKRIDEDDTITDKEAAKEQEANRIRNEAGLGSGVNPTPITTDERCGEDAMLRKEKRDGLGRAGAGSPEAREESYYAMKDRIATAIDSITRKLNWNARNTHP